MLVVEDSRPIARVIKQIGESLKYEVIVAKCMVEVEELLESGEHEFFVATIDYALPDANDGEAIPYILSHKIPGVVMTGKMDETTRQKIWSKPVVDYIPKENSHAFIYLKRILEWQLSNHTTGILVVDDSLSARNHVAELLRRRKFDVYVAEHGQHALEVLKQHNNIKMVITDLEMPVMGGIELTNEIRKNYSRDRLAIIGISGASTGIHSARFIKNGADDFLRKPFCPEEFYCRITQNIESLNNIEQITKAANTDYLTELPNRRAFIRDAQLVINERIADKVPYAMAMLDIDFFKLVNDNYGHDAGDHVLRVLSLYMRKYFGKGLISRLGGEEFSILISGEDEDQLFTLLDDFRKAVANIKIPYEHQHITFSVSIGVIFNSEKVLAKQMNLADEGLYFAKENGRNQVKVVDGFK